MDDIRILVVDDEPPLLKDLKWATERTAGSEVLTARNAKEAIKLIAENDFDLVVTDQRMEKEDSGLDVLAAAKEKDGRTQLILVTAYGKPTGPKAIAESAYDYVDRVATGNYLGRLKALILQALVRRQQNVDE